MKGFSLYILLIIFLSCEKEAIQKEKPIDNPSYDKAFEYLEAAKSDSAFFYFGKAKQVFSEAGDSLFVAKCLINMAIIQIDQGDYFGAQETSLEADAYLNKQNKDYHRFLSMNFNNLGNATGYLLEYKQAIKFYESAIKYSDNPQNTLVYRNNLAMTYVTNNELEKAREIYDDIINRTHKGQAEYARVLSNLAKVKWLQDPNYNAISEFLLALKIREQENDMWGQNASLYMICEYYTEKQPDSALFYAHKRYAVARAIASPDDQIKALQKLINLSPSEAVKPYFETYNDLKDSVQLARSAAKNQFALIRYEVEKNKADNLSLQKDNAEKAFRITRQRMWTGAVSVLFILAIVGGAVWFKRRKQRLELEADGKIKASQLRTSRKIHDVVANGLYRVMTEIENRDDIDRDGILDRLEIMYEKSRDISYEVEETTQTQLDYHKQVTDLLKSFVTENRKVIIAGNDPEYWKTVNSHTKYEIHHVLQELMVNMRKHSQASDVVIRFDWAPSHLNIYYSDNGVGLSESLVRGNGLTSTGNRIAGLDGKITFVSKEGKGLKVEVSIPIL